MAIPPLAGRLLSGWAVPDSLVRPLRAALRYCRDQQHLLPPAGGGDFRKMARAGASSLPVLGQGEPFPYPYEEAERPARSTRAVLRPCRASRTSSRAGPVSAAPWVAGRPRP